MWAHYTFFLISLFVAYEPTAKWKRKKSLFSLHSTHVAAADDENGARVKKKNGKCGKRDFFSRNKSPLSYRIFFLLWGGKYISRE